MIGNNAIFCLFSLERFRLDLDFCGARIIETISNALYNKSLTIQYQISSLNVLYSADFGQFSLLSMVVLVPRFSAEKI